MSLNFFISSQIYVYDKAFSLPTLSGPTVIPENWDRVSPARDIKILIQKLGRSAKIGPPGNAESY